MKKLFDIASQDANMLGVHARAPQVLKIKALLGKFPPQTFKLNAVSKLQATCVYNSEIHAPENLYHRFIWS